MRLTLLLVRLLRKLLVRLKTKSEEKDDWLLVRLLKKLLVRVKSEWLRRMRRKDKETKRRRRKRDTLLLVRVVRSEKVRWHLMEVMTKTKTKTNTKTKTILEHTAASGPACKVDKRLR